MVSEMYHHLSNSLIAGLVSGGVTRLAIAPLDVLKIRFQLQLEPIKSGPQSKYSGVLNAMRIITREEGISAFWKGFIPGQCFYILYGGAQFATYEGTKRSLHTLFPTLHHASGTVDFLSGSIAGAVATIISFPFDMLRTRMIGQGEPKIYKNTFRAIQLVYSEGGVRAFYRGLSPALLSVMPLVGMVFSSYGLFTALWDNTIGQNMNGVKPLVCGGSAAVFPKLFLMPLDFLKKRLEIQGFEAARASFGGQVGSYRGLLHCLLTVYKEEGVMAFYKGSVPTVIKVTVSFSLSFATYEHIRNFLATYNS